MNKSGTKGGQHSNEEINNKNDNRGPAFVLGDEQGYYLRLANSTYSSLTEAWHGITSTDTSADSEEESRGDEYVRADYSMLYWSSLLYKLVAMLRSNFFGTNTTANKGVISGLPNFNIVPVLHDEVRASYWRCSCTERE